MCFSHRPTQTDTDEFFAKRCSFRSDKACRGVALAKTGHPNEISLLGNALSISQHVRVSPCGSVANQKIRKDKKLSKTKETIKTFIVENFLFGSEDGLKDETSFLEEGIIDSTGILELVTFLEEEFSIAIEDEELVPENLDSINNVTAFLEKKIAA